MKRVFMSVSAGALLAGLASQAMAQAPASDQIEEIIVTGTRTSGLRAADSPAPVQVLGSDLIRKTGQPNLIQALAQNLPSIQAQSFGGDTQAFNLSFKLRGTSPNHTLLLINGKRRHGMANVAVSGGPFGGNAAADASLIPPAAIDHVEVLQEGAAAQYGTDAIAGVVNIFLKKNASGGQLSVTGGKYFDEGGKTGDVQVNFGFEPFENAYLNVTAQAKYKGFSFRGDLDPRVINTGFANNVRANVLPRFPAIANIPGYPYVNLIHGDAEQRQYSVMVNGGYEFSENLEFYTFGGYSYRWGQSYQNYRLPNVVVGKNPTDIPFPAGFQPKQNLIQDEYSFTGGLKGSFGEWNFDLSTTYGHDFNTINVLASGNSSLYFDTSTATTKGFTPNTFHNGDFVASQWTNTLDITREFEVGLAEPLNFAAGVEYREDRYGIRDGDPASYYGTGAQSFFGYSPVNASDNKRHNKAGYIDIAVKPVDGLSLDAAVRYEDYSDFGDTTVFKLTGRYDFNEMIAVRGTASTGFRAPTLGEGFYSGINVGPTSVSGIFAPNSPGAQFLGIAGLGPEKSRNFSAGLVTHFLPRLTVTLDAYSITIKDRIMQSGSLRGFDANPNVITSPSIIQALEANGVTIDPAIYTLGSGTVSVQSFVNGMDTRTQGVDLVATYSTDFGDYGRVDWSLSTNYNSTRILKVAAPPSNVDQRVLLFDVPARANVTSSTPKWRGVLGASWTWDKLNVNVREAFYGGSHVYANKPIGAGVDKIPVESAFITDLEVSYQVLEQVRVSIGANNLFNKYPNTQPAAYRAAQYETNSTGYVTRYPTFSPYGINGGFYYARLNFTF